MDEVETGLFSPVSAAVALYTSAMSASGCRFIDNIPPYIQWCTRLGL
jgi:hypothetical protein